MSEQNECFQYDLVVAADVPMGGDGQRYAFNFDIDEAREMLFNTDFLDDGDVPSHHDNLLNSPNDVDIEVRQ
jgi:hypothetical protein